MSEPLPSGWKCATVGELSTFVRGVTFKKSEASSEPSSGLVPIARAGNVESGRARLDQDLIYVSEDHVAKDQYLCTGDILVATSSGSSRVVGKSAIITEDWRGAHGAFMGVIRPKSEIYPAYLGFHIQSDFVRLIWRELAAGTNINNLKRDDIITTTVPLPPVAEQKRIADAIEEHFSRIDTVESAAQTALAKLDTLRRTVLTAAFSGRLIESLHPRRTLDGLLEDWQLSTIGEVTEILDSKRIPLNREERAKRPGNVPYYGATGQVGWIDEPIFNEQLVLLGEDGAPFLDPLKDKAYMIDGPSWVNNHAHVLKADANHVSNDFLKHQLNCCPYNDYVTGTTRLKLTQRAMRSIPLKLPPLPEQEIIVDAIEEHFSRIDAAKAMLERCLQRCGVLRRSVLAAAFSGRLVDQDPNDEPASVLLERIAAEQPKPRTRRKSA